MAQTTGTIPPQPPPAEVTALPPPPDRHSSNEIINAGHRFFGGVSRDLAGIIEKAVSQWGLPNGYILGEEASGAFIGGLRYGDGTLYTRNVIQEMPVRCASSGKDQALDLAPAPMVRGR